MQEVISTLKEGLSLCIKKSELRNLILENLCYEGYYSTAKEYLQPLLKGAALAAPIFLAIPVKFGLQFSLQSHILR